MLMYMCAPCARGILIHSLGQTIHYLTTEDEVQRTTFENAERSPRWYWGLIQVHIGAVLRIRNELFQIRIHLRCFRVPD